MADGTTRFLTDLEARFEGSLAREESEAADELARSLRADQKIYDAIVTWRGARLIDGPQDPVASVAPDHLVLGDPATCVVRLESAVLNRLSDEKIAPIRRSDAPLCVSLRPWARRLSRVNVTCWTGSWTGSLVAATPDHVTIEASTEMLIPYEAIRWVRLSRTG